MRGKLIDNAKRIKDAALPKSEELLEPDTSVDNESAGTGKPGGKPSGKNGIGGGKPLGGAKQGQPKQAPPDAGMSQSSKSSGAEQPREVKAAVN